MSVDDEWLPEEALPPRRPTVLEIRKTYPRAYDPWPPEDDERLVELYRSGIAYVEIAREFGRQPSAIRSRVKKLLSHDPPGD